MSAVRNWLAIIKKAFVLRVCSVSIKQQSTKYLPVCHSWWDQNHHGVTPSISRESLVPSKKACFTRKILGHNLTQELVGYTSKRKAPHTCQTAFTIIVLYGNSATISSALTESNDAQRLAHLGLSPFSKNSRC